MGKYYDVAEVEQNGKLITRRQGKKPRTANVAVLDNGVRKIAVDVTRKAEFDHFYQKYKQGFWLTMDMYNFKPSD